MVRSTFCFGVLPLLVAASLAHPASAAKDGTPLPRYRLEVGQELTYIGKSDFKFTDLGQKDGSFEYRDEWKVWVIRKNDDGSFRVAFSFAEKMRRDGKEVVIVVHPDLAYCDVFDDGRIVEHPSLTIDVDPTLLFRRLPADRKELANGWEQAHDLDGRSSFKVISQPANERGRWSFEEVRTDPQSEVLLKTHKSSVTFDPGRGLVTKVRDDDADGWAFKGKGNGTIELVSVERRDLQWIQHLWNEIDRYCATRRAYERKLKQVETDAESAKKLLDEAKALLTATQSGVSLPIVKDRMAEQIKVHDRRAAFRIEEARRRASVVGRPAPPWQAADLNGHVHSLDEFRGKVVILDFFTRGCGCCTMAMPQIKQLAAELNDQPVVVLGMFFGEDADARFDVGKLGINFLTLRADKELLEKYRVTGIPTFLIIDQKGVVQDMRFGYTPTLQNDLGEIVRELVAKP